METIFRKMPDIEDCYEVRPLWKQEPRRIFDLAVLIANLDYTDQTIVMLNEVLVDLICSRSMGLNENASSTMYCVKHISAPHDTIWIKVGCLSCARSCSIPLPKDLKFNGFVERLVILKAESST